MEDKISVLHQSKCRRDGDPQASGGTGSVLGPQFAGKVHWGKPSEVFSHEHGSVDLNAISLQQTCT